MDGLRISLKVKGLLSLFHSGRFPSSTWQQDWISLRSLSKTRTASPNFCTDCPSLSVLNGQFFCGNKRCETQEGLKSWEVNFAYVEHGEKRNALVKLRLCPECSYKLNYHHKRKEVKAKKNTGTQKGSKKRKSSQDKKQKQKRKDRTSPAGSEDSEESDKAAGSEPSDEEEDQTEAPTESDHWKGPAPSTEEKSREEEYDEYFKDMFL